MSSEAQRRQLQSHQYDLARSSPGTYAYSIAMDIVVSDKCLLATELFWEGIREKSRAKVQEALNLTSEAINYYADMAHYNRDMLIMQQENRAEWQAKLQDEPWWDRRNNMASEPEMSPAPTRADVIKYLQAGGLFEAAKAYLLVKPEDAPAYVIQQMRLGSDLVSDRGIPVVRTLIQFWEEDSHTDLPPEALETIPKVFKLKLRFLEEVLRTLDLNEATRRCLQGLQEL